jgi:Glycosyl transferase family 2
MTSPLATVAFVPREVFSTTERALETLLARTPQPFDLVCVDGGSPPFIQAYLERRAKQCNFTLVRSETFLTPNQGRNLALDHVRTKYVVFVDNDVRVAEGWLQPLVECAEQTGAWLVGPQYFEFEPEETRLHMYGGLCRIIEDKRGRRTYVENHHLAHRALSSVDEPIVRRETEMIEFHTVLVAMVAFRQLGRLDEQMMNTAEHGDLCLAVRAAGHKIYADPTSKVTYVPPKRLTPEDQEFFFLRWSEAWAQASLDRLNEKWGLSLQADHNARTRGWVAVHRRYGMPQLALLRRCLGRRVGRTLEKWFVAPWEQMQNRRRYPFAQYGRPIPPQVRVLHAPALPPPEQTYLPQNRAA